MSKSLATWCVIIATNIITAFWLWFFGIFEYVFEMDLTYLTEIISILYVGVLLYLPFEFSFRQRTIHPYDIYARPYYIANHLPALGLLGTVLGLMFAVNAISQMDINVDNPDSIVEMMKQMFQALGTSLITTIVGIILSLFLKTELMILDAVFKSE